MSVFHLPYLLYPIALFYFLNGSHLYSSVHVIITKYLKLGTLLRMWVYLAHIFLYQRVQFGRTHHSILLKVQSMNKPYPLTCVHNHHSCFFGYLLFVFSCYETSSMKRRDWLFKLLLLKYLFIFILCAQCFVCVYMQHMCAVHTQARRGHWITRNWCHSQLWATMGLLGARPESSARTANVLKHYITPSILLKLYAAEAQWVLEEYSKKGGERSALAQTIVTSRPHDVPESQRISERPPSPVLYSSVSDSWRDRMTISVYRLRHHKYQSAALSLLDAWPQWPHAISRPPESKSLP